MYLFFFKLQNMEIGSFFSIIQNKISFRITHCEVYVTYTHSYTFEVCFNIVNNISKIKKALNVCL